MLGRAKAGVLPLSVFGALFASAARMIPDHPGFAAFRKSAKKDAFWKARERVVGGPIVERRLAAILLRMWPATAVSWARRRR